MPGLSLGQRNERAKICDGLDFALYNFPNCKLHKLCFSLSCIISLGLAADIIKYNFAVCYPCRGFCLAASWMPSSVPALSMAS